MQTEQDNTGFLDAPEVPGVEGPTIELSGFPPSMRLLLSRALDGDDGTAAVNGISLSPDGAYIIVYRKLTEEDRQLAHSLANVSEVWFQVWASTEDSLQ